MFKILARWRSRKVASSFKDKHEDRRVWYWWDPYTSEIYMAPRKLTLYWFKADTQDIDSLLKRLYKMDSRDFPNYEIEWASPAWEIEARKLVMQETNEKGGWLY